MHENYFKAAIPDPYRIFGVQLLPLSLGRYRLLKRFDCGFVADETRSATMEDLLVGILICSMPVRECVEFLNQKSEKLEAQLKRWGKRIRAEIDADPYFNYLAKVGLFRAYIEENSQVPKYWDESPDSSSGSACHWSQSVEVALRAEMNYGQQEIDEGPLAKALYDYFKHAENQGLIRLVADGEEEAGQANANLLKEALGKVLCLA